MLQRVKHGPNSVAEIMIGSFKKDDALKDSLGYLEDSIACIEHNKNYADEMSMLRLARLALREKILIMAYE
jgi:hypothetical protein